MRKNYFFSGGGQEVRSKKYDLVRSSRAGKLFPAVMNIAFITGSSVSKKSKKISDIFIRVVSSKNLRWIYGKLN
jgi:hypothetical protein